MIRTLVIMGRFAGLALRVGLDLVRPTRPDYRMPRRWLADA